MCRHLAYLGPPVTLSALMLQPAHALLRQSWAPNDMRGGGTVNADGFGVGWYAVPGAQPVRYRRGTPIWSDPGFAELAESTRSTAVLAAVRSATVGMPVSEAACAPFADDGWLFSHNGVVTGWPDSIATPARQLPVVDLMTLDAPTDAAVLWAMLRHRLRGGTDPAAALAATVREVASAAPGSRLNLLLTDGSLVYASTWGHSLSVCGGNGRLVLASEPYDDDAGWQPLPDHRLISGDATGYTVEKL